MLKNLKPASGNLPFAVVRMTETFPKKQVYFTTTNQIIRCATSPAANYRAACRARSDADFINKLKTVEEELDETLFWLESTIEVDSTGRTHYSQFSKKGMNCYQS